MEFNFTTCAAPPKTISKYAEPIKNFYESNDEYQSMEFTDFSDAYRVNKGFYSYLKREDCEYKTKVKAFRRGNIVYLHRI